MTLNFVERAGCDEVGSGGLKSFKSHDIFK